MKKMWKRVLSFVLAIAMVASMTMVGNMTAEASTLTADNLDDKTIEVAVDEGGVGEWSANGNIITGKCEGYSKLTFTYSNTTTLTITNDKGEDAILMFDYKVVNGGTVTLGTKTLSNNGGSEKYELAADASVDIKIKSKAGKGNLTELTISNLALVSKNAKATTTFLKPENGSYTVDGVNVEANVSYEKAATETYTLSAKAAEGNVFFGWYNETTKQYFSYDANTNYTSDKDSTVTPVFMSNTSAVFAAGGKNFTDLGDAADYAKTAGADTIVVMTDCTISGDYVIPEGVTLLIPFDDANTCYKENPEYLPTPDDATEPKVYRTLTLASGASITVEGAISVSSKYVSAASAKPVTPTGDYGCINMAEGSDIIINDGGSAYVWGYIIGDGTVTAKSGAKVYELMQITDFRGGNATLDFVNFGIPVFPFSQYYVQNIEVKEVLEYGAEEYVHAAVYMSSTNYSISVKFIGTSDAMFQLGKNSSLTKKYDPSKDRMDFTVNGNLAISNLALELGGTEINSADFVLPITNNISIEIESGTTTVSQNLALLPGAEIMIDEGATVNVAAGNTLHIYDREEWLNYYDYENDVFVRGHLVHDSYDFIPVKYSPTRTYTRTDADLKDAVVDINGTLAADGYIYTTMSGADVISSKGTGKVQLTAGADTNEETSTITVQVIQNGTEIIPVMILTTPAQLHNADGSYTQTAEAEANSVFVWGTASQKWMKLADAVITFEANNETTDAAVTQTVSSDDILAGKTTTLNANTFEREGYTFTGWNTEADGTGTAYEDGAIVNITENVTLYAQWKAPEFTLTFVDEDDTLVGEIKQTAGTAIENIPNAPEKVGYDFVKWTAEGYDAVPETMPSANVTFKPVYEAKTYTVTLDKNGAESDVPATITVKYGEKLTNLPTPGKTGSTFKGWFDGTTEYTVDSTMPASDLTLKAEWEETNYKLTIVIDGKSNEETLHYGDAITLPAAPEKEGNTFAGWVAEGYAEVPTTMPADNLTIKATWTPNKYNVNFMDGGELLRTISGTFGTKVNAMEVPDKDGYDFKEWNTQADGKGSKVTFPLTVPANETTVYAIYEAKEFTLTFLDVDGETKLYSEKVAYASDIKEITENAVKEVTVAEGYAFTGWVDEEGKTVTVPNTMGLGDVTYKATTAPVSGIKVTYMDGEQLIVTKTDCTFGDKLLEAPEKEGYKFVEWNTEADGKGDKVETVPAKETTVYAIYEADKFVVKFVISEEKTVEEELAYGTPITAPKVEEFAPEGHSFGGWTPAVDATVPAKDVTYTAIWNKNSYTITLMDGDTEVDVLTFEFGEKVTLPKLEDKENFAFIGWDGEVPETMPAQNLTYTAQWKDTFTGWKTDEIGTTYYVNGQIAYKDAVAVIGDDTYYFNEAGYIVTGLVEVDDPQVEGGVIYYYFEEDGKAIRDKSVYLKDLNGILPEWEYEFDEEGIIIHDEDTTKNGIHEEDGVKYYYINGIKAHMGMVLVDGSYYYARSSGALVVDRTYWISRVNGKDFAGAELSIGDVSFEEGSYTFDKEGKLVIEEAPAKDGIVAEEGSLYYYENGVRVYKGLMLLDGNYYYVRTSGELAHSTDYWTTKTNGLMDQALYTFDKDGKMVIKKNGIVAEEGSLFYYENGVRVYKGLMLLDGDYYYVRTSGELAHSTDYWTTKTNGLMDEALYTFDKDGKMVKPEPAKDGIVAEEGTLYYYENGVRTYKGLFEKDGHLYYAKTSGEVVNNRTYWITKTNGLLPEKSYTFNELGQIVSE